MSMQKISHAIGLRTSGNPKNAKLATIGMYGAGLGWKPGWWLRGRGQSHDGDRKPRPKPKPVASIFKFRKPKPNPVASKIIILKPKPKPVASRPQK